MENDFKRYSLKPFCAIINIGLEIGYKEEKIKKKDIILFIQKYQNKLISSKNIYLSCSITKTEIVLSGQVEKHLKIGFINYPKFQLKESILKNEIEILSQKLMDKFNQNRIVVEYLDETVMFEKTDKIDNRIKTKK